MSDNGVQFTVAAAIWIVAVAFVCAVTIVVYSAFN